MMKSISPEMSSLEAPLSALPLSFEGESETIRTRFGEIEVYPQQSIVFENGLLGVPSSNRFAVVEFPNAQLSHLRLLQSLDEKELCFITMPMELDNNLIDKSDLEKAAQDVGLSSENLAILLIVSVHRTPNEVGMSVNARAPLLVDVVSRSAVQYVFQHSRYKVQHFLDANAVRVNAS
jgi:flagellar assembly factor FliW